MKNSKKFSDVAKKSLAVALTGLSLTESAQNVSAMKQAGTELDYYCMLNVMQNIHDKEMLKKFEQVNKKCRNTFEGTFMNPISVTEEEAGIFFPELKTQHFYKPKDVDRKIEGKKYAYDYLWNESAAISNANFITRKDMDDKSFLEVDNCDIENENYKKPDTVKLSERESAIYESIKKFILSDQADFNKIDPMYHKQKCFETIKLDNFENGVECQIKKFKDRNGTPKAFVCVVVPDDGTFKEGNMDTIKQELSGQSLATCGGLRFNFENVNLVIRPKIRTAKFEIGEHAIDGCDNSTINAQGATISGKKAICYFNNSTINAQGATISGKEAICYCRHNSTINAQGAKISGKKAISHHFFNSTINAQGATISGELAISYCKNFTINAKGATISGEKAIWNCHNPTINAQEAKISGKYAINNCHYSTINAQEATIFGKYALYDCCHSTINAQEATISGEEAICYFYNSTINAQEATISGEKAICNCEKSTINAQGAKTSGEKAICYCDKSIINAQGAKTYGRAMIYGCQNFTINVNEGQVSDVAHKVFESRNVKINDRLL